MEKQVYRCECGYTTHFEKALTAHCNFRHHKPLMEKKESETILPEVAKELKKAIKQQAETAKAEETKKTRKPRVKKTAAKEQK